MHTEVPLDTARDTDITTSDSAAAAATAGLGADVGTGASSGAGVGGRSRSSRTKKKKTKYQQTSRSSPKNTKDNRSRDKSSSTNRNGSNSKTGEDNSNTPYLSAGLVAPAVNLNLYLRPAEAWKETDVYFAGISDADHAYLNELYESCKPGCVQFLNRHQAAFESDGKAATAEPYSVSEQMRLGSVLPPPLARMSGTWTIFDADANAIMKEVAMQGGGDEYVCVCVCV